MHHRNHLPRPTAEKDALASDSNSFLPPCTPPVPHIPASDYTPSYTALKPRRSQPAAQPSGPAGPQAPLASVRPPLSRASRASPYTSQGPGPPHPQRHHCSSRQVRRGCWLPLSRARRSPRTAINTALIPLPRRPRPTSGPQPASPPDLTRGHRTGAPALRLSPVKGDAKRKEPSAYAHSGPAEPATNERGSSDRLANHLGAAGPPGATSRTVALTTSHSSHCCGQQAPHHLSPWLGQPIASRVPELGPAYWPKSPGGASMEGEGEKKKKRKEWKRKKKKQEEEK
uniref:LIM domain-binding protein 3-like n=1 Tax=Panthera onca TaxID=9690 RepID=UPI002953DAB4|nr:LIM domain-binding protein 3-like [Panthera onca]